MVKPGLAWQLWSTNEFKIHRLSFCRIMVKFQSLKQLIRYGVVGLLNNLLGYLFYLFITFFWLDPKVVITIFYPLGAVTTYFGHLKYSFSYQGRSSHTLLRYALAYLIGYGANLMMLFIFSDQLKLPHQAVQALAIPLVAGGLFLMLKFFVFFPSEIRGAA